MPRPDVTSVMPEPTRGTLDSEPRPVARSVLMLVVGPVVPVLVGAAAGLGLVSRLWWPGAAPDVDLVVLVTAVVVGLPHGALDVALLPGSRRMRPARLAGYACLALLAYAVWWAAPSLGTAVLLGVAAVHFSAGDVVVARWRRPADPVRGVGGSALRGCATGLLAVAGPFAFWPAETGVVLDHLGAGSATGAVTTTSRVLVAVAVAAAVATTAAAAARRDWTGALEFWALAALVVTCRPLFAFGIYFACWHSLRQSVRLLELQPTAARRLRQYGVRSAVTSLALRAAAPSLAAAGGLALLVGHHGGVTAGVLVALLVVSVPHALVAGLAEHRASRAVPAGRLTRSTT